MISWYQKVVLFLKFCKHLIFCQLYIYYFQLITATYGSNIIPPFLGSSIHVSNTTNRLDGTLCYKDNNFTLDNLPAFISTPCRLNGKYIMLHSKIRQDVKYTGPIVVPFPFAVVYGNVFYS